MTKKTVKLTKVEKAILELAKFMQDPCHHDYRVHSIILDILGYESLPKTINKSKK